eukprot:GHVP01035415.1.p1 GENE.GHVP01035415.1~~GHVP01035415.1.p1  ORF type:complete len:130 (-),score=11.05 GHVP01035415.1:88-477(-)
MNSLPAQKLRKFTPQSNKLTFLIFLIVLDIKISRVVFVKETDSNKESQETQGDVGEIRFRESQAEKLFRQENSVSGSNNDSLQLEEVLGYTEEPLEELWTPDGRQPMPIRPQSKRLQQRLKRRAPAPFY